MRHPSWHSAENLHSKLSLPEGDFFLPHGAVVRIPKYLEHCFGHNKCSVNAVILIKKTKAIFFVQNYQTTFFLPCTCTFSFFSLGIFLIGRLFAHLEMGFFTFERKLIYMTSKILPNPEIVILIFSSGVG